MVSIISTHPPYILKQPSELCPLSLRYHWHTHVIVELLACPCRHITLLRFYSICHVRMEFSYSIYPPSIKPIVLQYCNHHWKSIRTLHVHLPWQQLRLSYHTLNPDDLFRNSSESDVCSPRILCFPDPILKTHTLEIWFCSFIAFRFLKELPVLGRKV